MPLSNGSIPVEDDHEQQGHGGDSPTPPTTEREASFQKEQGSEIITRYGAATVVAKARNGSVHPDGSPTSPYDTRQSSHETRHIYSKLSSSRACPLGSHFVLKSINLLLFPHTPPFPHDSPDQNRWDHVSEKGENKRMQGVIDKVYFYAEWSLLVVKLRNGYYRK